MTKDFDITKDPNYMEGYWVGQRMVPKIHQTTYGTLEVALGTKQNLAERFRQEFQWEDTEPELAKVLGTIAALQEALENGDSN